MKDMPLLTDDWLASPTIATMLPEEEGGYIRLLCLAWRDPGCCLPDDDPKLAMMSRLGARWNTGGGAKIRQCFQPDPKRPGYIYNAKQRQLKVEQDRRVEKSRSQRRDAANSRWGNRKKRHATAMREQCDRNATVMRPHNDRNAGAMPQFSIPPTGEENRELNYTGPAPSPVGGLGPEATKAVADGTFKEALARAQESLSDSRPSGQHPTATEGEVTLEEVVAYGEGHFVPADFCRDYWTKNHGSKNQVLRSTKNGGWKGGLVRSYTRACKQAALQAVNNQGSTP